MSDQPQPVRTGDVYPPSASAHDARRQRDEVLGTHGGDQQQNQDGDLRVTEADEPHAGRRVVTATAGGQVMAQFTVPVPGAGVEEATDAVTIGEALQAAAQTSAGDRPVDLADAAAVQAAETRATGLGRAIPGGVAAAAQQAAESNMRPGLAEEDKVRLMDVLGNAADVLPANKVATREDAVAVATAAERNAAAGGGGGGGGKGVANAVAAAAEMNERRMTRRRQA
ncbi:late embryogenesis abundant protein 3-like [Hordeum vulgare subsp. vulgare]|uniref:late embryogenesis abundant protein 3-like n=1 Tax=Hordeum vulgare subsp. vulgare TaxID=112509 RepID=UPI000B485FF3|nr:late embryogenesis abundant protein 3-like [Hordeum vulgare subsp. vulgare]